MELPDLRTREFEKFSFDEAMRVLRSGGFPTGTVLCANDRVAFGVLSAACRSGLKVGHDDHPLSRYTCPPITTVAQNYEEIDRFAIELLLGKLNCPDERPSSERRLLTAEIMLRASA